MAAEETAAFMEWFKSRGGSIDASVMNITRFPEAEGGRGVQALKNIPVSSLTFAQCIMLILTMRQVGRIDHLYNSARVDIVHANVFTANNLRCGCVESTTVKSRLGWIDTVYDVGGSRWKSIPLVRISELVSPEFVES